MPRCKSAKSSRKILGSKGLGKNTARAAIDTMPEIKVVQLAALKPAPYNPREISDLALSGLQVSLQQFGYVALMVVNKRTMRIIAGHQRYKILLAEKIKKAPVILVDVDKTEERAMSVTLNNPAIAGTWTSAIVPMLNVLKEKLGDDFIALRMAELEKEIDDLGYEEAGAGKTLPDDIPPVPKSAIKKCKLCGIEKPLADFYLDKKRGLYSARCKKCHSIREKSCIVCGKLFIAKASKRICSEECRKKYRPQTFKVCENCGVKFGPVSHLRRRYCSSKCKREAQKTGRHRRLNTKEAKKAQRRLRYAFETGIISRPAICEECGRQGKVEGAHYNYSEPLRVRWLCARCHHKWDREDPKGGMEPTDCGAREKIRSAKV